MPKTQSFRRHHASPLVSYADLRREIVHAPSAPALLVWLTDRLLQYWVEQQQQTRKRDGASSRYKQQQRGSAAAAIDDHDRRQQHLWFIILECFPKTPPHPFSALVEHVVAGLLNRNTNMLPHAAAATTNILPSSTASALTKGSNSNNNKMIPQQPAACSFLEAPPRDGAQQYGPAQEQGSFAVDATTAVGWSCGPATATTVDHDDHYYYDLYYYNYCYLGPPGGTVGVAPGALFRTAQSLVGGDDSKFSGAVQHSRQQQQLQLIATVGLAPVAVRGAAPSLVGGGGSRGAGGRSRRHGDDNWVVPHESIILR